MLRKFPVLSETFVLNEILALEDQGVPIQIFSLGPTRDSKFHEGIAQLEGPVWYIPGLTDLSNLWKYNRRAQRRFGWRYWRTLLDAMKRFSPSLIWSFFKSAYIAERAASSRIDHLHCHFANHPADVTMLAHLLTDIPFSFTAHAYDIFKKDVSLDLLKEKLSRAEFVVTISQDNVKYLGELMNGIGTKIHLVRNGIDMQNFTPLETTEARKFTIVTVARLVEKKGLPYLVEACRILREKGFDFECQIIGKGNLRSDLEAMIQNAGLSDTVNLLGSRKHQEVRALIRKADLYVLPSIVGKDGNKEGLPVTIIEALASGVPVISTPIAGIPEAVRDKKNGYLVPEKDSKALAEAIESAMTDSAILQGLKVQARKSVIDDYDMRKTSKQLRELFCEDPV